MHPFFRLVLAAAVFATGCGDGLPDDAFSEEEDTLPERANPLGGAWVRPGSMVEEGFVLDDDGGLEFLGAPDGTIGLEWWLEGDSLYFKIDLRGGEERREVGLYLREVTDSFLVLEAPSRFAGRYVRRAGETTRRGIVLEAERLRERLDDLREVEGEWGRGDASSTFTAYFDEDELRYLREEVSLGEYGSSQNEYFFRDGRLFLYQEEGERAVPGRESPRAAAVTVRISYGSEGEVFEARKTVNGEPAPPRPDEVEGASRHAEELRRIAVQEA